MTTCLVADRDGSLRTDGDTEDLRAAHDVPDVVARQAGSDEIFVIRPDVGEGTVRIHRLPPEFGLASRERSMNWAEERTHLLHRNNTADSHQSVLIETKWPCMPIGDTHQLWGCREFVAQRQVEEKKIVRSIIVNRLSHRIGLVGDWFGSQTISISLAAPGPPNLPRRPFL